MLHLGPHIMHISYIVKLKDDKMEYLGKMSQICLFKDADVCMFHYDKPVDAFRPDKTADSK